AALYFLALPLRDIPVGVAYAMSAGVGIVRSSLLGGLCFKQHLAAPALLGLRLTTAGVVGMSRLSTSAGHGALRRARPAFGLARVRHQHRGGPAGRRRQQRHDDNRQERHGRSEYTGGDRLYAPPQLHWLATLYPEHPFAHPWVRVRH